MVRGGTPIQSHELEDIRMNREIIILVRKGATPPNELEDIRMNWVSIFFRRHTNELEDIRMHWNTHNELGFSLFLGWKTYE